MFGRAAFDDVLEEIASGELSSGSGKAAASALALGIACLRKAIAVTARHRPDDRRLDDAQARLCALQDSALTAGQADAIGFPRLAGAQHSREKARAADDLTALATRFERLCAQLIAEADQLAPLLRENMANDILAARRLADAAAAVMQAIGEENSSATTAS